MGWFYSPQGATKHFTTASGFDTNIPQEFNTPTLPHSFTFVISENTTLGSTVSGTAAVTISGLPSGSRVRIINNGRIQGHGGSGGKGGGRAPSKAVGKVGGGGGGGAGCIPGYGGPQHGTAPGATEGEDGTKEAGGAGGSSVQLKQGDAVEQPGFPGGHALNAAGIDSLYIYNVDGEIWGGGGGGAGADNIGGTTIPGGQGGGPGEQGYDAQNLPPPPLNPGSRQPGGEAGKAIELGESTIIIWEGGPTSSGVPNVKGEVS